MYFCLRKTNMNYQELTQRITSVYDAGEARALVRMVFDIQFGMSKAHVMAIQPEPVPISKMRIGDA